MPNKKRGEVEFKNGDETYTMCMNLGAMAEIEDGLELDSITELSSKFAGGNVKARHLIILLGALIRGGGHDITDQEVGNFDLDAIDAFGKAMEAIGAQGGKSAPKKKAAARKKR